MLRDAGLIHGDRNGTSITYHLNVSLLEEALLALFDTFSVRPRNGGEQRDATAARHPKP